MNKIIQGPKSWWNRKNNFSEFTQKSDATIVSFKYSESKSKTFDYPWYTLSAPIDISMQEYNDTVAFLQRLVNLAGNSGGHIILPKGWFWNPIKNKTLLNQPNEITKSQEIPDDIA